MMRRRTRNSPKSHGDISLDSAIARARATHGGAVESIVSRLDVLCRHPDRIHTVQLIRRQIRDYICQAKANNLQSGEDSKLSISQAAQDLLDKKSFKSLQRRCAQILHDTHDKTSTASTQLPASLVCHEPRERSALQSAHPSAAHASAIPCATAPSRRTELHAAATTKTAFSFLFTLADTDATTTLHQSTAQHTCDVLCVDDEDEDNVEERCMHELDQLLVTHRCRSRPCVQHDETSCAPIDVPAERMACTGGGAGMDGVVCDAIVRSSMTLVARHRCDLLASHTHYLSLIDVLLNRLCTAPCDEAQDCTAAERPRECDDGPCADMAHHDKDGLARRACGGLKGALQGVVCAMSPCRIAHVVRHLLVRVTLLSSRTAASENGTTPRPSLSEATTPVTRAKEKAELHGHNEPGGEKLSRPVVGDSSPHSSHEARESDTSCAMLHVLELMVYCLGEFLHDRLSVTDEDVMDVMHSIFTHYCAAGATCLRVWQRVDPAAEWLLCWWRLRMCVTDIVASLPRRMPRLLIRLVQLLPTGNTHVIALVSFMLPMVAHSSGEVMQPHTETAEAIAECHRVSLSNDMLHGLIRVAMEWTALRDGVDGTAHESIASQPMLYRDVLRAIQRSWHVLPVSMRATTLCHVVDWFVQTVTDAIATAPAHSSLPSSSLAVFSSSASTPNPSETTADRGCWPRPVLVRAMQLLYCFVVPDTDHALDTNDAFADMHAGNAHGAAERVDVLRRIDEALHALHRHGQSLARLSHWDTCDTTAQSAGRAWRLLSLALLVRYAEALPRTVHDVLAQTIVTPQSRREDDPTRRCATPQGEKGSMGHAHGPHYTLEHLVALSMHRSGWFCIDEHLSATALRYPATDMEVATPPASGSCRALHCCEPLDYSALLDVQLSLPVCHTDDDCAMDACCVTALTPAMRALLLRWSTNSAARSGLQRAAHKACAHHRAQAMVHSKSKSTECVSFPSSYCTCAGMCARQSSQALGVLPTVEELTVDAVLDVDGVCAMLHPIGRVCNGTRSCPSVVRHVMRYHAVSLLLFTLSVSQECCMTTLPPMMMSGHNAASDPHGKRKHSRYTRSDSCVCRTEMQSDWVATEKVDTVESLAGIASVGKVRNDAAPWMDQVRATSFICTLMHHVTYSGAVDASSTALSCHDEEDVELRVSGCDAMGIVIVKDESSLLLWLQCAVLCALVNCDLHMYAIRVERSATSVTEMHGDMTSCLSVCRCDCLDRQLQELCTLVNARGGVDAVYLLTRFLVCGEGRSLLPWLLCPGGPDVSVDDTLLPSFAPLHYCRREIVDTLADCGCVSSSEQEINERVQKVLQHAFYTYVTVSDATDTAECAASLRCLVLALLCHSEELLSTSKTSTDICDAWRAPRPQRTVHGNTTNATCDNTCLDARASPKPSRPSDVGDTGSAAVEFRGMSREEMQVVHLLRQQTAAEWVRYANTSAQVRELCHRLCGDQRSTALLRSAHIDVVHLCSLCVHRWLNVHHAPVSCVAAAVLFARVGYDAWMSEVATRLMRFVAERHHSLVGGVNRGDEERWSSWDSEPESGDDGVKDTRMFCGSGTTHTLNTTGSLLVALLQEPFELSE